MNRIANLKAKKNNVAGQIKQINWRRLGIAFASFVIISFLLAYLVAGIVDRLQLPLYEIAALAYVTVFAVSIVTNLSLLVPVPLAVTVMVAAATRWDPILIAACGALGGAIGELSGYYAGYLGKKIAIPEGVQVYERIEGWVKRWGFWAILVLALQPILPFDIGGFVAGAARMPVSRFFPALVLGKFPKYLVMIYTGLGLIRFFPWISS